MPSKIIRQLLLRRYNAEPYTGWAFGHRGPVYWGDLPEGTIAETPAGLGGVIVVSREHGLSPETLVHELVHLRQQKEGGPLFPYRVALGRIAEAIRRVPPWKTEIETPAYEDEERARQRQEAEGSARRKEEFGKRRLRMALEAPRQMTR